MAGLTPFAFSTFRRLLRARGSSLENLAAEIGTGRAYLSRVLWGHFASPETWARIHAVVTPEEWRALCDVEHCPAWNNQAPDLPWCVRVVCGWCGEAQPFKPVATPAAPGAVSHGLCPACFDSQFPQLRAMAPAVCARVEYAARSYLVRTEAGLQVHDSREVPALADARDFATGDDVEIETTCRLSAFTAPEIGRPFP